MNNDSSTLTGIKSYWQTSKTPFYSLIFTLPLLIAYELMIFSINRSDILGLRNGADILFRQFFSIFHIYGFYLVGFVVLIALGLSYYFYSKRKEDVDFSGKFFILMFVESILYAVIMIFFVNAIGEYLINTGLSEETYYMVILALGAGVYEEFIFRVVLVSGFLFFLHKILKFQSIFAIVMSVIYAALLFSLFHYVGNSGEAFEISSFVVRFGAGVFLSGLYALRGYGITAYTHTFYDLLVILG